MTEYQWYINKKICSGLVTNTAGQKGNTKQLVLRPSLFYEVAGRRLAVCHRCLGITDWFQLPT